MADKKMFISFVPWLLFSVMINRRGADAAGWAAAFATALALFLAYRGSLHGVPKVIDATSVVIFGGAVHFVLCHQGRFGE
ncbi:MAG TPA: hypothetical protein VHX15_00465 [Frankiaceae bacterium]|nr:hypothetical protein [Frankiaceae bacterium]